MEGWTIVRIILIVFFISLYYILRSIHRKLIIREYKKDISDTLSEYSSEFQNKVLYILNYWNKNPRPRHEWGYCDRKITEDFDFDYFIQKEIDAATIDGELSVFYLGQTIVEAITAAKYEDKINSYYKHIGEKPSKIPHIWPM